MIAVFFAKSGHVASVWLQERKIVKTKSCINICLPKVFEAWDACHPNNGTHSLLLHHDIKKCPQRATPTLDYLEANCNQLFTQILHSPGLAPCDFFLFPQVKQQLKGKQFQGLGPGDAWACFEGLISDIP